MSRTISCSSPSTGASVGATKKEPRTRLRRSRKSPFPNSILDRPALTAALQKRGLFSSDGQKGMMTAQHLDTFYQALHRQHYPDLDKFVENYRLFEAVAQEKQPKHKQLKNLNAGTNNNDDPAALAADENRNSGNNSSAVNLIELHQRQQLLYTAPLKNNMSMKKNRNRKQLPRVFLEFLSEPPEKSGFVTITSKVDLAKTSSDGSTTKIAVGLHDGLHVESVLMRYKAAHSSKRASLCVSSQVGCAMQCTFCATGTMGLSGNLTAGEILEQMVHANRILAEEWLDERRRRQQQQQRELDEECKEAGGADHKKKNGKQSDSKLDLVRNVVFMGMGEPLDNYNSVVEACRAMLDRKRWNLAESRVTVSTVGIISKMRKLTQEMPAVSLALSLHAPTQELRTKIVPTATHYPLPELIDALDNHMMAYLRKRRNRPQQQQSQELVSVCDEEKEDPNVVVGVNGYTTEQRIKESSRRRAMIEYVMLDGPTSTLECAHALGKLCQDRQLLVNLIPYNPVDDKDELSCPTAEHIREFQAIVASYGTFCTTRRTMGQDINSACGQLITLKQNKETAASSKTKNITAVATVQDIEDAGVNVSAKRNKEKQKMLSKRQPQGIAAASQSSEHEKALLSNEEKTSADDTRDLGKEMEQWIRPLAVATAISGSCFLFSAILFARQRMSQPYRR